MRTAGVYLDDAQTVADHLIGWLDAKVRQLKPTTVARYRDYLHNGLLPAFDAVRLERLTHQHIYQFVRTLLAAGRGPVNLTPLHRPTVQRAQRRHPPTPTHPQRSPLHRHPQSPTASNVHAGPSRKPPHSCATAASSI
jgi:hypothetical protein